VNALLEAVPVDSHALNPHARFLPEISVSERGN